MASSRFQIILIAALACGLGAALSSGPATGYPTSAVSRGSNPIWNAGGTLGVTESVVLATAPSDQDMILVDLLLSKSSQGTPCELRLSDGTVVGAYYPQGGDGDRAASPIMYRHGTGVRVPAGETLTLANTGSYSVYYAVSGYYAQP